jgi:AraC-like DNA-binding protein
MSTTSRLPIQFSCYFSRSSAGEQFVPEHTLAYVVSGNVTMNDGNTAQTFAEGEVYFCRRNQLAKYTKQPGASGEYRSVSIYFEQDTLRDFSLESGHKAKHALATQAVLPLPSPSVLSHYMESLRVYEEILHQDSARDLIRLKQREAILLLLKLKPSLNDVLFDFSEPGKIDLEAFMNKNYHFNVELKRYAYLTGRSLSTFKRDFEKIFHETPSRWLLHRRLEEAHYRIKEQKKSISDVYVDLGFEDLSHFSYAFKKQFGIAPSMV